MYLIERIAYAISKKSRARKYQQFLDLIDPKSDETLLDVGANVIEYSETDNYLEKHYSHPEKITIVSQGDVAPLSDRYPNIHVFSGDGTTLPFENHSFDIVYSNAVIEHVGSRERQIRFLQELHRVAKRGYITTPNRLFPIELHTRIPLLHLLLPKRFFDALLKMIGKEWATGDYMNLLSRDETKTLLKEAKIANASIIANRFFGFPMTYTIVWNNSL